MENLSALIDSYVAVWNETDANARRRRIREVWSEDGTTCYRLLDSRGYEAIESRVTGSADKWLGEGKYRFRPKRAAHHHDAIKLEFELVTLPDEKVEANGLSFLLLAADGRIKRDYQFNPSANDAHGLIERYVASWSEPDTIVRQWRIAELWAPDGSYVSESKVCNGIEAIEAEVAHAFDAHVAKGFVFAAATRFQAHHNVARLTWEMRAKESGAVAAAGSDLLILDDQGRIRFDCQFNEIL